MQRTLKSLVQLTVCLAFASAALVQAADEKKAADPTGTWKSSYTTQSGQTRESTFTLKAEGGKVTGTVSGRNGDSPIENGTIKGEDIAFDVSRDINGTKVTTKYTGKISGDTIKGKADSTRDGQPQSREFEAKREAAKPKEPAPAAK